MVPLNKLEKRIIDISYKNRSSHLSSCLTAVNMIDKIYLVKSKKDKFVLSNGHAFLALAAVLEKYEKKDAEDLFKRHGTHPVRSEKDSVWVSTGSLGQGITIAVGMALANRKRNVFVMMSDGELAEGSCWEALRIAGELRLENLRVEVNANGYSAMDKLESELLDLRLQYFFPTLVIKTNMFKYPDFLQGVMGHYKALSEAEYKEITQ